jgi:ferrochelatase
MENRDYFLDAGGERYEYIPCLNAEPEHIDALTARIERELAGWVSRPFDGQDCQHRAVEMGAER